MECCPGIANPLSASGARPELDLPNRKLTSRLAEVLQDFLFSLLEFQENWFSHHAIIVRGMSFSSFQENFLEVEHALLGLSHFFIGLDHDVLISTTPRRRKSRPV